MRAFVLSLALCASCVVEVNYDSTAFRCSITSDCPPDYECDIDVCRLASAIRADAAPPPDATSCPRADADGEVTAFLTTAITIDGALEAAWSGARSVEFSNPAQSDNTARVSVLWDASNLYFAFEIADAQLEAISEPNRIFRDDGSEFYLDMNHDETPDTNADDAHYIANIDGVVQSGTLATAVSTTAGGYIIEHALAWSETVRTPNAGETLGLLVGNNDRDNDISAQYDWRGLIDSGSYTRPNLWGDLHLSDTPASAGCQ